MLTYIHNRNSRAENRLQNNKLKHNIANRKSFRYIHSTTVMLPPLGAISDCGCILLTVLVADAPAVAVQLAPQAKPVGQHPPPAVSAQLNQPLAHRAAPVAVEVLVVLPTGNTIVRPSEVKVELDVMGQEVVSQFRPVRQQPPW
jgi:hypothetical protein